MNKVASIAIGTTPTPPRKRPTRRPNTPQIASVRRKLSRKRVAPNTKEAMKRATLENPLVAFGIARGRRMKTAIPNAINVRVENKGMSYAKAHSVPEIKTAATTTPSTRTIPMNSKPTSPDRVSFTVMD